MNSKPFQNHHSRPITNQTETPDIHPSMMFTGSRVQAPAQAQATRGERKEI